MATEMREEMKPVAYVIAPYRAATHRDVVLNIRRAEAVAVELWRLGFAVICPHTNSALLSGACDEQLFLDGYHELVRRSDLLVATGAIDLSRGSQAEIVVGVEAGLPLIHWQWSPVFGAGASDVCREKLTTFMRAFLDRASAAKAAQER